MSTEEFKKTKFSKQFHPEEIVRQHIKSLFDNHPNNDPLYHIYHTIDQNLTPEFIEPQLKNGNTKTSILRIVEFFNTLHLFEAINDFVRDAYLNDTNLRHGFLTNGVLLKVEKKNDKMTIGVGYTINDLVHLHKERPELYKSIVNEITVQLEELTFNKGEQWYFWPGCEMRIPRNTKILIDPSITKSKFVVTRKTKKNTEKNAEIILQEKSGQVDVSLRGQNKLSYKESSNSQQAKFKTAAQEFNFGDFSEIEFLIKNGDGYTYTLHVPYDSPRLDVKTHMKIHKSSSIVEEVAAACT